MKIMNSNVNNSFSMIKNDGNSSKLSTNATFIAKDIVELQHKNTQIDSVQYLQHALSKNQQAFGILSQLKVLIKEFIETSGKFDEFQQALSSTLDPLHKMHSKFSQRLKNSELTPKELLAEVENIIAELGIENKRYADKIATSLITIQNKDAVNNTKINHKKISTFNKILFNHKK